MDRNLVDFARFRVAAALDLANAVDRSPLLALGMLWYRLKEAMGSRLAL